MARFLLASSTHYGIQLAESLIAGDHQLMGVLAPAARPQGRKQQLVPAVTTTWAEGKNVPVFIIENKIKVELQDQLPVTDFLLVVDFGFYIPAWLISFPKVLAFNVHPSALPAYRGASPGQYVLWHGCQQSAVSFITLASAMDAGDLIAQIPFAVNPTWNGDDYYQHAFTLAGEHVSEVVAGLVAGTITPTPQQGESSLAPKISKQDALVPWLDLQAALSSNEAKAVAIERQIRAFNPWPLVWSLVPTAQGAKRLQLLTAKVENGCLLPLTVKLEGEGVKPWAGVKQRLMPK